MSTDFQNQIQAIQKRLNVKNRLFKKATENDIDYLMSLGVPSDILTFYKIAEPVECIEIENARLWPISELQIENEDAIPGYVIAPLGYIVIATTLTGDTFCLNLNNTKDKPEIVIASHDEIYEGAKEEEIKAGIITISDSFLDFLNRFAEGNLPSDFYDFE